MKLLQVAASNFLSWERFKIDLNGRGLVFIVGNNGVGKTALFDAVEWCLYGKISKRIPVSEIVNSRNGKNCHVRVILNKGGHNYQIHRYRKHDRFGNTVRVVRDGDDISASLPSETDSSVLSVIGISRAAFNNSVLFSEDSEFYFSTFSDAAQKDVLRDLLGLGVLTSARKLAKHRFDDLEADASTLELDYETKKARRDTLKEAAAIQKDELEKELEEAESDLERRKKQLEAVRRKLRPLDKELDEIEIKLEGLEEAKDDLETAVGSCPTCSSPSVCPSCGHSLRSESISKSRYKSMRKQVGGQIKRLTGAQKEYLLARAELIEKELDLEGELRGLEATIKRLRKRLGRGNKHSNLDLDKDIARIGKHLRTVKAKSKLYSFWMDGFGKKGVELFALNTTLPVFNSRLKFYLDRVFPGTTLEFYVDDKGKLEKKLERTDGAKRVGGLSKGQKRRVDICTGLALQDTMLSQSGFTCNVLMLDEVFEGLDREGIRLVVELLRDISRDSTFIISHRSELRDNFGEVIEVKMEDGISRFV